MSSLCCEGVRETPKKELPPYPYTPVAKPSPTDTQTFPYYTRPNPEERTLGS